MTYIQQSQLGESPLETFSQGIQAVSKIMEDPGLPEVSCLVLRLNRLTEGLNPGPACPQRAYSAAEESKGIGLTSAVGPLRNVVWARENPLASAALGAGVVWLIWYFGFSAGKATQRRAHRKAAR